MLTTWWIVYHLLRRLTRAVFPELREVPVFDRPLFGMRFLMCRGLPIRLVVGVWLAATAARAEAPPSCLTECTLRIGLVSAFGAEADIPTVSLGVTSAVVNTYGCDDGRISPTH